MTKPLIILDLDGTLYNTQLTTVLATQEAFKQCNIPIPTESQITSLIGSTTEEFCRKLAPSINDRQLKTLVTALQQRERALIISHGSLYTGISDMLHRLVALGYTLTICSNGSLEYIHTVLKSNHILHHFISVRGRDSNLDKAAMIQGLMDNLKYDHAMVIGDTMHDIKAARANGLPIIGVNFGYGEEIVGRADFVAENPQEILQNILRISIFYEVLEAIKCKKRPSLNHVVGINGVDTSGKSMFCQAFDTFLNACGYKTQVIHIDDFHNAYNVRSQNPDEIQSYLDYAFDLEKLERELLLPISNGQAIDKTLLLLDLDTDQFTRQLHYKIDPETIVLLEGVLLYREPINAYFDTRIFIDVTFDTVLERATLRDVPKYGEAFLDKYRKKYIPLQKRYLDEHHAMDISNFIINNNNFMEPILTKK